MPHRTDTSNVTPSIGASQNGSNRSETLEQLVRGMTNLNMAASRDDSNTSMVDAASPTNSWRSWHDAKEQQLGAQEALGNRAQTEEKAGPSRNAQEPRDDQASPEPSQNQAQHASGLHDVPDGIDSDSDDDEERYVDFLDPETRDEFGNFQIKQARICGRLAWRDSRGEEE